MKMSLRRRERGYALAEAMVGGAVMLFAVGGVTAGFIQARAHITRAMNDRLAAQLGTAQIEILRSLPYSNASTSPWASGTNKPCSADVVSRMPNPPPPNPIVWTCQIDVTPVTDAAVAGVVGSRQYQRARVLLRHHNQIWVMETVRW